MVSGILRALSARRTYCCTTRRQASRPSAGWPGLREHLGERHRHLVVCLDHDRGRIDRAAASAAARRSDIRQRVRRPDGQRRLPRRCPALGTGSAELLQADMAVLTVLDPPSGKHFVRATFGGGVGRWRRGPARRRHHRPGHPRPTRHTARSMPRPSGLKRRLRGSMQRSIRWPPWPVCSRNASSPA